MVDTGGDVSYEMKITEAISNSMTTAIAEGTSTALAALTKQIYLPFLFTGVGDVCTGGDAAEAADDGNTADEVEAKIGAKRCDSPWVLEAGGIPIEKMETITINTPVNSPRGSFKSYVVSDDEVDAKYEEFINNDEGSQMLANYKRQPIHQGISEENRLSVGDGFYSQPYAVNAAQYRFNSFKSGITWTSQFKQFQHRWNTTTSFLKHKVLNLTGVCVDREITIVPSAPIYLQGKVFGWRIPAEDFAAPPRDDNNSTLTHIPASPRRASISFMKQPDISKTPKTALEYVRNALKSASANGDDWTDTSSDASDTEQQLSQMVDRLNAQQHRQPLLTSYQCTRWKGYESTDKEDVKKKFLEAFSCITLFTYRTGLAPLYRCTYKDDTKCEWMAIDSDVGWGCAIRAGQMLLMQVLKRHFLDAVGDQPVEGGIHGEGPYGETPPDCCFDTTPYMIEKNKKLPDKSLKEEIDLLECFLDLPAPAVEHPFSLYGFIRAAGGGAGWAKELYGEMHIENELFGNEVRLEDIMSRKGIGKFAGEWFGPTTISFVIKMLVEQSCLTAYDMYVYVSTSGLVDEADIHSHCKRLPTVCSTCDSIHLTTGSKNYYSCKKERTTRMDIVGDDTNGEAALQLRNVSDRQVYYESEKNQKCYLNALEKRDAFERVNELMKKSTTADSAIVRVQKWLLLKDDVALDDDWLPVDYPHFEETGEEMCSARSDVHMQLSTSLSHPRQSMVDLMRSSEAAAAEGVPPSYEASPVTVDVHVSGCSETTEMKGMVERADSSWKRACLVMFPLTLSATSRINSGYRDAILAYLELPWTVGFIGGRNTRAFYCVGKQDQSLLYLDPHCDAQEAAVDARADYDSFYDAKPLKLPIDLLNPSISLAFYCRNEVDFCGLMNGLKRIAEEQRGAFIDTADTRRRETPKVVDSPVPPSKQYSDESLSQFSSPVLVSIRGKRMMDSLRNMSTDSSIDGLEDMLLEATNDSEYSKPSTLLMGLKHSELHLPPPICTDGKDLDVVDG